MSEISVRAKNLTIKFGNFCAVDDISFEVFRGEVFGFLGANGAGKTTTIRALCGLLIPTMGDLMVAGHSVAQEPVEVKKHVGYMSQKFTLYPDMSVRENLDFAASLRKLDMKYYLDRKKELFELIGFKENENLHVKTLPSGILQQVALVAASLHNPDVIFLDEPTAGVTPSNRYRFWELIRLIVKEGKTVFVTTHYMDEAEKCDRIALMRSGKIIALDTPVDLKKKTFPQKDSGTVTLEDVFVRLVEGGAK